VCLPAMFGAHPHLKGPINKLVRDSAVATWRHGKQSKMKPQVITASTCKRNPQVGFVRHWTEPAPYVPVDMAHATFDGIANPLNSFSARGAAL